MTYADEIDEDLAIRAKKEERNRKIANGEKVSDSSSIKNYKNREKEELLNLIRQ